MLSKLLGRKSSRGRTINYKTVGLVGLVPGAGTTHLSIMLANFCANGLHKRTALVINEFDDEFITYITDRKNSFGSGNLHKDIQRRLEVKYYSGAGQRHGFRYRRIDIFHNVSSGFMGMIKDNYDVVIMDAGLYKCEADRNGIAAEQYTQSDFFMCDKKILVGSMEIWKFAETVRKLKRLNIRIDVKGLEACTLSYERARAEYIEQEFGVNVLKIPLERDPFCISGESLMELGTILSPSKLNK